jgi:hypothetical protein
MTNIHYKDIFYNFNKEDLFLFIYVKEDKLEEMITKFNLTEK